MLLHTTPLMTIYFGNAQDQLYPDEIKPVADNRIILEKPACAQLKKVMHLEQLIFLHQVHGTAGAIISETNLHDFRPFSQDGDFIITKTKAGIGVLTADCLPIIMYDNFVNVVAIVHAGWRGSVSGVVKQALETMHQQYNVQKEHIKIFFGPSAKVCCYKVSPDFIQELDAYPCADQVLVHHNDNVYFDLPLFNRLMLEEVGIKKDAICTRYNICTICNNSFYSYRRQGKNAGRQMTVVSLR